MRKHEQVVTDGKTLSNRTPQCKTWNQHSARHPTDEHERILDSSSARPHLIEHRKGYRLLTLRVTGQAQVTLCLRAKSGRRITQRGMVFGKYSAGSLLEQTGIGCSLAVFTSVGHVQATAVPQKSE